MVINLSRSFLRQLIYGIRKKMTEYQLIFCFKERCIKKYERNFSRKKIYMNTCIEIFNEDCPIDYLSNTRE